MNVCLITSVRSGPVPLAARLAKLGYRVVVLHLHPQLRSQWIDGQVIHCSPVGGSGGAAVEGRLSSLRNAWRRPLQNLGIAKLLAWEQLAYRVVRKATVAGTGALEGAVFRLRGAHRGEPLAKLPFGPQAYAVFLALDAAAAAAVEPAARQAGATFLGPQTPAIEAACEAALMHWLGA